jgi:SAM-dependent methyltransferase
VPVVSVKEFVLANLPRPPARVLEVGCGHGRLARELDEAGYRVTAIDPAAPDGPIFRRIKLEELEEDAAFDAVVGVGSFHHMGENLETNLDRVSRALGGGGPLLLDEFGPDRLHGATAAWYEQRRRRERPSVGEWDAHHEHVTPSWRLLEAVRARFAECLYEDVPYLWRYVDGVTPEHEASLVRAGEIQALGFRFVGVPAPAG